MAASTPRRVCRNLRSGIIYADHLSDNDFMAADVMTIILAAAAGVTVYLVAHFVIGQIRIPIYPFIIAIVLAVITAGVVYFTLRNNPHGGR